MARLWMPIVEVKATPTQPKIVALLKKQSWDSCHLILALDGDQAEHTAQWMTRLTHSAKSTLAKNFPSAPVRLTTFALAWPTNCQFWSPESLGMLVEEGICLREKTSPLYQQKDLCHALRQDLTVNEVLPESQDGFVEMQDPVPPPPPPTPEDKDYQSRLAYYQNPPFRWSQETLDSLLGRMHT